MKKNIVLSLLCLSWLSNYAQAPLAAAVKKVSTDYVEVKNYYLLSLFDQDNEAGLLLKGDA
jgi:hypothetical protein